MVIRARGVGANIQVDSSRSLVINLVSPHGSPFFFTFIHRKETQCPCLVLLSVVCCCYVFEEVSHVLGQVTFFYHGSLSWVRYLHICVAIGFHYFFPLVCFCFIVLAIVMHPVGIGKDPYTNTHLLYAVHCDG